MAMTFETSAVRPHTHQAPRFAAQTYTPQRDVRQGDLGRRSRHWRIKPLALALVLAIVAVAVIGFGSDAAATNDDPAVVSQPAVSESVAAVPDAIEIYVVQPGDTLWEIATELAAPGEDVRQLVDALEEIAGGSQLDVGQRLIIEICSGFSQFGSADIKHILPTFKRDCQ